MKLRAVTILLMVCALVTTLVTPALAGPGPTSTNPGSRAIQREKAAEWINDHHVGESEGFSGFELDAAIALNTSGLYEEEVTRIRDNVLSDNSYYGPPGNVVVGPLAKTLFIARSLDVDITEEINGRDLLGELVSEIGTDGGLGAGDSVFGQSFGILALDGYRPIDRAADWLVEAQCDDGGFSFNGTCEGDTFFGTDVDSTATAMLALDAAGRIAAFDAALEYVLSSQSPNGGFPTSNPNVNSTGVAGGALRDLGYEVEADAAWAWILDQQFGPEGDDSHGAFPFLPGEPGANGFATNQALLVVEGYPTGITEATQFSDVAEEPFGANVEWLRTVEVTLGCNPPKNDLFCPTESVSRAEMAAFLVRALELTETGQTDFEDVPDDNTFSGDIDKLAHAGITRGCNPPDNTRFCPNRTVTRAEMAAFLSRSLHLTPTSGKRFDDVATDSRFVEDIDRLATAGITLGCNPPENTNFCPQEDVLREQMAAFLHRSFDLEP